MSKEAYYFSHDANARHDPKILAMRNEFGIQGYGVYWLIVEMLREQEDYKLPMKSYIFNAIAMQMQCKVDANIDANYAKSFVDFCINECDLFEQNATHFWSNSLLKRMDKRNELSDKRRAAAKMRWEKPNDTNDVANDDDANAMQTDANAMQVDARKGKEKKEKENKVNNILTAFGEFWSYYPRKLDKKKALEKFKTACKKHEPQIIIQGAMSYAEQCKAKGTLKEYIKHPTTFLNAESFLNDFDTKPIQPGRSGNHGKNEDARKFAEENNIPF